MFWAGRGDYGSRRQVVDEMGMGLAVGSDLLDDIVRSAGAAFERGVPLGPLTWYGVGGEAQVLAHPADEAQLGRLVRGCREAGVALRVLGKGANLLVCEGTIQGVVVRLDLMRGASVDACGAEAQGGADLEKLITATVREGLEGLESLAGIPATVGGALRMNAGGAFGAIGPLVESVTCVDGGGAVVKLNRDQLSFGYRASNLGDRIVTGARFALGNAQDRAALRERLKEVMRYKKESQPMAASSAGCAFKNPQKDVSQKGAGKLIDEAGAKGLRFGGAEVSQQHANFIVLHEGGRASDVLALMERVERVVADHHGIQLQREVVIWLSGEEHG